MCGRIGDNTYCGEIEAFASAVFRDCDAHRVTRPRSNLERSVPACNHEGCAALDPGFRRVLWRMHKTNPKYKTGAVVSLLLWHSNAQEDALFPSLVGSTLEALPYPHVHAAQSLRVFVDVTDTLDWGSEDLDVHDAILNAWFRLLPAAWSEALTVGSDKCCAPYYGGRSRRVSKFVCQGVTSARVIVSWVLKQGLHVDPVSMDYNSDMLCKPFRVLRGLTAAQHPFLDMPMVAYTTWVPSFFLWSAVVDMPCANRHIYYDAALNFCVWVLEKASRDRFGLCDHGMHQLRQMFNKCIEMWVQGSKGLPSAAGFGRLLVTLGLQLMEFNMELALAPLCVEWSKGRKDSARFPALVRSECLVKSALWVSTVFLPRRGFSLDLCGGREALACLADLLTKDALETIIARTEFVPDLRARLQQALQAEMRWRARPVRALWLRRVAFMNHAAK